MRKVLLLTLKNKIPKIHKPPPVPLRQIVASRGSITYEVSKFVAAILAPLVGTTPYHIKNSHDLTEKLSHVHLEEDETIVSHDVVALFPSVPVDDSINIIKNRLEGDNTLTAGH